MTTGARGDELDPNLSAADRIDAICDDFEQQLIAGKNPLFETYLKRVPETDRSDLRRELDALYREYRRATPFVPYPDETTPLGNEQEDIYHSTRSKVQADEMPKRIGRYRTIDSLGHGGYGQVFRANDDELGREVAIKVPHRKRIRSQEDVDDYVTEARTVAQLDHHGIVPVYDTGHDDDLDLCFVVSKYISGNNLAAILRQGKLPGVGAGFLAHCGCIDAAVNYGSQVQQSGAARAGDGPDPLFWNGLEHISRTDRPFTPGTFRTLVRCAGDT